jgi:two-component system, cell cycle sensor histidine kinase and response regulator CckA
MKVEDCTKEQLLAEVTHLRARMAACGAVSERSREEAMTLRKVRGELEVLLAQRTHELLESNTRLELEVEEHSHAQTKLSAELEKFQALYELAVAMTAERTLDENLALVVETGRKLLAGDTSYIALRDEEAGSVYMDTLSGIHTESFKKMRIPFGAGLGGKVAQTGKGFIVQDYFKEVAPAVHDVVREEGLISGVAVPIQMGKKSLGVLYVFNRTKTAFTKSDLDTLSLLGNLAAVEIVREQGKAALRKAQGNLERRIEQRTAELRKANEELTLEMARRQTLQEALEESEKRYRLLFDHAGDAIYVLEPEGDQAGQIVSANEVAAEMHGYTVGELLGMNIAALETPESGAKIRERIPKLYAGETIREEVTHVRKDGTVFPLEINVRLFELGDQKYVLGIDRDVTERKSAEDALRSSEQRMRRLIELAPIGIRVARNGDHIYVNPAFVRMFGYNDPSEIVGRPVVSLYVAEDGERIPGLTRKESDAGQAPSYHEVRGLRKNGDRFDAAIWETTIDYEGEPAALAFVVDAGQEKSLRDQLLRAQKMESLGTLAGGVAHDFNNILTVVLGYSDMLLMCHRSDEKCLQRAQAIRTAARRGSDLVQQILTFTRKTEPKLQPVDLNRELKQAEQLLHRTIPRMIEIELQLEDNLSAINADPGQIEQIVLNLAVNAKHAMPKGGKLIFQTKNVTLDEEYFRTRLEAEPGEYVLLRVSDTGHGMGKAVLDRIFEPFFTTKQPGEGTGLGLSMVFGIVKNHGGHISCLSEPGRGTVFEIYLPAIEQELESPPEIMLGLPGGGSETLLLVDDEDAVREMGRELLHQMGYSVITARSGRAALDIYRESGEAVSLVILDLVMPDMSGGECLEELLKLDPKVKVIIASGYAAEGSLEELKRAAKGLIAKPYDVKQLLQAVRSALDED